MTVARDGTRSTAFYSSLFFHLCAANTYNEQTRVPLRASNSEQEQKGGAPKRLLGGGERDALDLPPTLRPGPISGSAVLSHR
jgi:hypothetical protein